MKRLALVGVGSPFGDDTLGWQLLDALAARGVAIPGWDITFSKADRPGPGLLDRIRDQDAAIIIDAMQSGERPGTLRLVELSELDRLARPLSGHAMGVAETLALGRKLALLPERLHIIGIEMGEGLPKDMVNEAVERIEGLISQ